MPSVVILGRQPALGLIELESLYGPEAIQPIGENAAAIVALEPSQFAYDRLGASSKAGQLLTILPSTQWSEIEKYLCELLLKQASEFSAKLQLGISVYGLEITPARIGATGLMLKKLIKKSGHSVRFIPNQTPDLNSAQVLHNRLAGPNGRELLLVRDKSSTVVAQTFRVQDITSYSRRDRLRPRRDAKVGMLPPKLAQIIINLANGNLDPVTAASDSTMVLLDPFCGTGVILQEAALMGYATLGTDNEARMIAYSRENLTWLKQYYTFPSFPQFALGDATNFHWSEPIGLIASETYLGKPFTSFPAAEVLTQTITDCNLIIKKFLTNLWPQLTAGTRLCIAVPAWHIKPGIFRHLPLIDQLSQLGYNRVSFERATFGQMIYYRPEQIVARELLVLVKQ